MVYAYPDAKIGMMDSKIAAEIMYPGADERKLMRRQLITRSFSLLFHQQQPEDM